jgi:protein-S-isoprenylcysteine O-methyltransferase Ste14
MSEASGFGRIARSARKHGVAGSLRVLATLAVVAVLLLLSRPTLWSVAAGLPFVALGLVFRVWASGHLLKSLELAVSGPYRHVQNPLYFGRLCLLTGFSIMAWLPVTVGSRVVPANAIVLVACLAVFFGYYMPRKRRVEGARLTKLHGEAYAAWARAVPDIIPRLRPYGTNVRAWSAERFHDNSEGLFVLVVLGVVAAFVVRALLAAG